MDEQILIIRINATHPVREGSTPRDITPQQQKAANCVGRLLKSAHRKGRRRKGAWV